MVLAFCHIHFKNYSLVSSFLDSPMSSAQTLYPCSLNARLMAQCPANMSMQSTVRGGISNACNRDDEGVGGFIDWEYYAKFDPRTL